MLIPRYRGLLFNRIHINIQSSFGSCIFVVVQPITLKKVTQKWVHGMSPTLLLRIDPVVVRGIWFISESGS